MLKLDEIKERAQTGNLPASALTGKPVSSGRWYRHEDLLKAVNSAREHWLNGARPRNGVFRFRFPFDVGEGYKRGTAAPVTTPFAIVVIKGETIITAYPVVDDDISSVWGPDDLSEVLSHDIVRHN